VRKPKKATPEKRALMLVVVDGGEVLLQQRPDSGIWGGLLSLPEVDGHVALDKAVDAPALVDAAAAAFGQVDEVQALLPLVHVFTHYKLHIRPMKVALAERATTPAGHVWWKLADIGAAPLPAPVKTLLTALARPSLF
jgi:A/G-specific adenine glycosylase